MAVAAAAVPPIATGDALTDNPTMPRWLIVTGVLLLLLGLVWTYLGQIGLGRLPGDITIERDHVRFYFPIVTCLIISFAASFILRLINRQFVQHE
jgi:formate hydrogenlyase subunit 3/multisubunit Na+/H+ antiporter MnhD subunit